MTDRGVSFIMNMSVMLPVESHARHFPKSSRYESSPCTARPAPNAAPCYLSASLSMLEVVIAADFGGSAVCHAACMASYEYWREAS